MPPVRAAAPAASRPLMEEARALADLCLAHLAEDPESLARFMAEAGYDPASLRVALGSPALTRGLIDHFATNEPALLALSANAAIAPEAFMRVWHKLNPGR